MGSWRSGSAPALQEPFSAFGAKSFTKKDLFCFVELRKKVPSKKCKIGSKKAGGRGFKAGTTRFP